MDEPLSTWNDGLVKGRILDFVHSVIDPSKDTYVPPEDRVAAFDNDGTLACEKPYQAQLHLILERLRRQADADPSLRDTQPYKAAWEWDMSYIMSDYPEHIWETLKLGITTVEGRLQHEFLEEAKLFFRETLHPRFNVPYTETIYAPMIELVRYLQSNEFKVFIVTGFGEHILRVISEEFYGIARENVIGSSVAIRFTMTEDGPGFIIGSKLLDPVDGEGKPENIQLHIGRLPILAFGNADGDVEMLLSTESDERPYLPLVLVHDDGEREYEVIEGAERVNEMALERGWTQISMKNDFKVVFDFEG